VPLLKPWMKLLRLVTDSAVERPLRVMSAMAAASCSNGTLAWAATATTSPMRAAKSSGSALPTRMAAVRMSIARAAVMLFAP